MTQVTYPSQEASSAQNASSPTSFKATYAFGKYTEGDASMRNLLGGKGANLAEMARLELPVPPGFTITTEVCRHYYANERRYPSDLEQQVRDCVQRVEQETGKRFGDSENPLLFSVRSGARESMPGMMDTILNLGLNDETVDALAKKTDNPRFALDCYRRFIQMYGDVVMGVHAQDENEHDPFEQILSALKTQSGAHEDTDLTADHLEILIKQYKELILERTGEQFPQDVYTQLWGAVGAVFDSWQNERAILYRQKYGIPAQWGTAVNVQAMVFGNSGLKSGTGVAFTRDPASGEKIFYGEYLINAQGEDVVAGVRTPKAIALLKEEMPESYAQLDAIRGRLEAHFKDMQDFEFTIEDGVLYMLQTRNGKRTGMAAVRIAVEMVEEGLIKPEQAVRKIPADSITSLMVPIFDDQSRKESQCIAKGLPAGPGAASGQIVFTASMAEAKVTAGTKVILCRVETSPEDLRGMLASEGILTSRGGVSSHAALVARQMGKVCVCGAQEIQIDYAQKQMRVGDVLLHEGDEISIDGTTGEVYKGFIKTAPSQLNQVLSGEMKPEESPSYRLFNQVMTWADQFRSLGVRTNADTPEQAKSAIAFGAEGIGLCRTEHMFFEGDRIAYVRQMILATDKRERMRAIEKILPFQRDDFYGLFKAMEGRPVTIRLLDPPLHEFLPQDSTLIKELADSLGVSSDQVALRVKALHELNPMLGHRGCRLGITYPEITEMQVEAIFQAAILAKKDGVDASVEIMVPLVGYVEELKNQVALVHACAKQVIEREQTDVTYTVGTMIEIPRACIKADEIAEHATFFSFGTNDLTQTTLGMSRDDAGSFLPAYKDLEILNQNPFATIDQEGVGALVEMGVKRGRSQKSDLKIGICGEHGGDPSSVHFFQKAGLDYVSCSPPRVPVARLAAAQAALSEKS